MAATKSSPEHWLSYRARRYLTHLTHSKNCFDDHKAKNKSKKKKKKKKKTTMFKQTILNYVCCRHTEDVQLNFEMEKVIFDKMTAFRNSECFQAMRTAGFS